MTPASLTTLIRRKTRTTSTTYTDAEILVDLNLAIEELAGRIQTMRPEIFNIPATFNLVANQREYAFPTDTLNNIVTVELKLASGDDYKLLRGLKQVPEALVEDDIVAHYSDNPAYFIRRKALYILSDTIPTLATGGRIVYSVYPAPVTDLASADDLSINPTTTTLGFPKEFHPLLATRVSMMYKDINGMSLNREELNYENDLEKKLGEFSIVDQSLEELINTPSGSSLGDNGYDY